MSIDNVILHMFNDRWPIHLTNLELRIYLIKIKLNILKLFLLKASTQLLKPELAGIVMC